MFRKKVTPEQRALVDRASAASAQMRKMLVDAATDYVALKAPGRDLDDQAREQTWEWVERIAVQWRSAEQAGATHVAVEDELSSHRPHQLLGAIEDSLILAVASDPEHHHLMLSTDETLVRIAELDEDGAWERVDIRPRPVEPAGERSELSARLDALADATIAALAEVSTVCRSLAPDGRLLGPDEVTSAREALGRAAACGRSLDADRDLTAALATRRDLRPSLGILRTMQQGLVLVRSADPQRRAQAITVPELLERIRPVGEGWKVPTEQQDT